MKAVLRHELSSYFTNLTGYVFGAFLLLFAGIYTMAFNLKSMLTNFEYVLGNMAFAFLIIVPILTMRVLAEEKKQKTDQLLYSLPLSMTSVVLGKYLALLIMFLIPVAIIGLYPVFLSSFGNIYLPASFSTLTGFFFMGAALIAIGVFISSITENQAVAAGVCFVVMLMNYYLYTIAAYTSVSAFASFIAFSAVILLFAVIVRLMTKNTLMAIGAGIIPEIILTVIYVIDNSKFEGLFPEIMQKLSLFERFYVFVDGVFDLTGIVYFTTIIAIFLFLSVQSMEKRRWSE